jgi:hypothetical protein
MSTGNTKAENKSKKVLSFPLEGKSILWLSEVNKYMVVIPPVDKVIELIWQGKSDRIIYKYCNEKLGLIPEEANKIVSLLRENLSKIKRDEESRRHENFLVAKNPPAFFKCNRYYRIYDLIFLFVYETSEIEHLIHPKFAHLEIPPTPEFTNHFQLFKVGTEIVLMVNGIQIGNWTSEMEHFMTGKVSMQILQKIYNKEENEWMSVFHAAGITNGKNCLIFLGDSGNGKSTLSAILMSSGLEVLADDFLPVESKSALVCHFPAAISVKDKALEILVPKFPQLKQACEINNIAAGKTFRYLSTDRKEPLCVPCKALVFVKYEKDAVFRFEEISGEEAFVNLVPDSWISPASENANRFVNWFTSLPYYRMTYSDNEQMVQTVQKMLNDDL